MKFGKIHDTHILDQMQWEMPQLDPTSTNFLQKIKGSPLKIKMGAPAWNHKEWIGKIYPEKTPQNKYLYHYSRYFNTIELNTTHYRIPTNEQAEKWKVEVPENFVFCPKVFQGLSHERNGLLNQDLLKAWFTFLESLQPHCGPCFIQMPPNFSYDFKAQLFKFLQSWPADFRLALELRHPSWFQEGRMLPALTEYLQSRRIGLVISDVAGRRDVFHSSISAEFTMIRFVGNKLHPSDFVRAQLWNQRLLEWEDQGLPEVIFFVHQPDDILVPDMTEYLKSLPFFSRHLSSPESSALADIENLKLF